MLFNSFEFAIFLPLVFIVYWFLINKKLSLQNLFLVAASYFFYGWWDWRFLSLIIISSTVDYVIGLQIYKCDRIVKRKLLLSISIFVNLGFLGFFKYYNFFLDNIVDLYSVFGLTFNLQTLKIILPVGISFYTFQTLSYTIDIYNKRHKPTKDIIAFFAFVSFFPQLVAGPIERARNLLPQFTRARQFNYKFASEGLKLVAWGLFKKVVIADSCAKSVEYIFSNYSSLPGSTLMIGAVYFAFQIYCDFSGYSDIARGVARLFGFDLMQNFSFPYFSRNIAEFWKRWHVSLSTWFRDYVYIPLGGNRCSQFRYSLNIMITFLLSGLWHGANWTFICWGALHGVYLLIYQFIKKPHDYQISDLSSSFLASVRSFACIGATFFLTTFAWIFFRAENIDIAMAYIGRMMSLSLFSRGVFPANVDNHLWLIMFLVSVEWIQRNKQHLLYFYRMFAIVRWPVYLILMLWIVNNFAQQETFIYFQF